jgi:hypothetical protein
MQRHPLITIKMEWISVNDKLPAHHEPVLVMMVPEDEDYIKFNNMQVAFHTANQWIGKDSGLCDVTHWLPLPPAPKAPLDKHFEAVKFASDTVMSHYVPADTNAKSFSFEITVEGKAHTAYYEKDADGYWDFTKYTQQ